MIYNTNPTSAQSEARALSGMGNPGHRFVIFMKGGLNSVKALTERGWVTATVAFEEGTALTFGSLGDAMKEASRLETSFWVDEVNFADFGWWKIRRAVTVTMEDGPVYF